MNTPLVDTRGAARIRPITIAILAMGGEGGGVLADWIIDLAEHGGYLAQMTSVPGVAQRTGATIYYVELFPKAAAREQKPVLALMPVPGDVDIVLASELMEAGRAITRGLVTPDRTTLIASSHRVFTMLERTALTDGRVDGNAMLKASEEASRRLHAFDMASIAEATGSLVSAVMFGALAGSGTLPFQRMAFEATIRRGGVGVDSSVRAFNAGFEAAASGNAPVTKPDLPFDPQARDRGVQKLVAGIDDKLSIVSRPIVSAGVVRLADYQNEDYAKLYLKRLEPILAIEAARPGKPDELLTEVARQLALAMAYEDTIRVAELKIRASRFQRVRRGSRGQAGPVARNRRVHASAHAGNRRDAAGRPWPLHPQYGMGAFHRRCLHPEGPQGEDLVDPRLPAALHGGEPEADAAAFAALDRRDRSASGRVARQDRGDRAAGLSAGGRTRACARSGEGLWRHP